MTLTKKQQQISIFLGNGFFKEPVNGWFLGVADTNDVIQKIEKTLNNTHTTTQKLTNNSFRNTKKHPVPHSKSPVANSGIIIRPLQTNAQTSPAIRTTIANYCGNHINIKTSFKVELKSILLINKELFS